MPDIRIGPRAWDVEPGDLLEPTVRDQVTREALRLLNRGHAVKLTSNGIELCTMYPDGTVTHPDTPGRMIYR